MKKIFSVLRSIISVAIIFCITESKVFSQTIIPAEIPTSYNVGEMGGFTYSIPLTIPPGIKEMIPSLAITYSSQGGGGNLGNGWSLAGMSSISRISTTIYHNHLVDPVDFDANDVFALDGQRLIETSSGVYMTEIKNFAKIEAHGTAGGGPSYFTVEYPNGTIYEYGNTVNSKMLAQGRSDVLTWCINKIYDLNGNYIEFDYSNDQTNGIYKISGLSYSLNSNVSSSITNPISIEFYYTTRPEISITWVAGSVVENRDILDFIEIKQDNIVLNKYQFTYEHNIQSGPDYFTHLTEIREMKPGNKELPPIKINWGNRPSDHYTGRIALPQANATASFVGDFNGDGTTDILVNPGVANNAPYYVNFNDKNNGFNEVSTGNVHYTITSTNAILTSNINSQKKGSLFFDYNGDGLDDLVLTIADHTDTNNPKLVLEYYQSDGVNLNYVSTLYTHSMGWIDNDTTWIDFCKILPGDYDGDGKRELILTQPWGVTAGTNGLIATGYNIIVIGDNYPTNNGIVQSTNEIAYISGHHFSSFVMDYDGNGKDDFCRIIDGVSAPFEIYSIDIDYTSNPMLASPGSSMTQILNRAYPDKNRIVYPGDFNGDGKSDLLSWDQTAGWEIYYSKGNGHFADIPVPLSVSSNVHVSGHMPQSNGQPTCYYLVGDYNGDGRDDILELGNTSKYYNVFYSYGYNGFIHETMTLPSNFHCDDYYLRTGDFNGDGQIDVMGMQFDPPYIGQAIIYFHPHNQEHLVTSIEHAGKRWDIEYKSLAQATEDNQDGDHYGYFPWSVNGHTPREYPYMSRQIPLKVVTSLKDNIALDNSYYYQTLSMHMTGFGMLGFEKMKISDNSKQMITENHYSLFPFWGTQGQYSRMNFLYETTTSSFNNPSYAAINTKMSYFDVPGNSTGDVRIIKNYGTIVTDNIQGRYQDVYTAYDETSSLFYDYGVPDSVHDEQGVRNGYIVTTTKYSYDSTLPSYNRWKHIVATLTSTYPSKPIFSFSESFVYNAQGLLAEHYDFNKTTYSYGVFGNVTSKVFIAGIPFTNKVENFEYSPDGRFMVKSTKYNNGYPFVDEYTSDTWGNILVHKHDILETLNEYDEINRVTKTTYPDNVTTLTEYDWAFNSSHNPPSSFTELINITPNLNAARFYIKQTREGIAGETYKFIDFYGRILRDARPMFSGSMVYTDADYYAMGKTHITTEPYPQGTPVINHIEYSYDEFGREESRTSLTGPSYTTSYVTSILPAYMASTVTNISNTTTTQVKTTYTDERGIYQVDDNGNVIEYSFASNGQHDEIIINSDQNLKTIFTYDVRGRLKTKNEPNFGITTYNYNKIDQVIREILPNGTEYTYTYDDFGNIKRKEDNYFNVYEYIYNPSSLPGNPVSGAGKLRQEKFTYYELGNPQPFTTTDNYEYDGVGRLQKMKKSIDANHTFITEYTYNPQGEIASIKYPSGLIVQKNYNQYGFLDEVRLPSRKLWQKFGQNHRGQLEYAEYFDQSSQVVYSVNRVYDNAGLPQMRRVNSVGGMFGTPIAWMDYTFDNSTGNLSSREDKIYNLQENFTYDEYDRLLTVNSNALVNPLQMRYNDEGNILSKDDISNTQFDWKYDKYALKMVPDADPAQPFPQPFFLSNVRQPNPQYISYHTFNKVKDIKEAGNEVHFYYGPNDERVKVDYNPGAGAASGQKTRYYGSNYEETEENGIITKIHYIWGDGEMVAIIKEVQGNSDVYFVGTDYLGSITHLFDGQGGGIVEERSFDAWGRFRDPANWQYFQPNTVPNWIIDRGYTGHEHIFVNGYDVNIINMNGRLYDPLTGRMFSPDPFVVDGTSSESYNKYSYAANNPLKYTDPDGKFLNFIFGALIGSAVNAIGYTVNVAFSDGGFNNWSWGGFGKNVAIGAVSGAITTGIGTVFGSVGTYGVVGEIGRAVAHGTANAGIAYATGGDVKTSFIAGSLGSLGGSMFQAWGGQFANSTVGVIGFSALSGGVGAELTGGDFWTGAATGAIIGAANHSLHKSARQLKKLSRRFVEQLKKKGVWDHSEKASNSKGGGKLDLYHDEAGNIYEYPKGRLDGPGEPTGLNIRTLEQNGFWDNATWDFTEMLLEIRIPIIINEDLLRLMFTDISNQPRMS